MSLRNVKKVQEAKSTQGEYYGSDDDFEPLCAQKSSKSTYEGLLLSNSSGDENKVKEATLTDTENENNLTTEEVEKLNLLEEGKGTENSKPECTQLEKKKKKKKQKSKKKHVTDDNVDEIDKSVSEVNAMLGEPSEPSDYINDWIQEAKACLFVVGRRHLNSSNELSRLFGPESDNEPRKKHGRRPNLKRIHRCKIIHKEFSFKKLGLSMSIERREKGLTYFVYDHTKEYQKLHREFMSVIALRNTNLMAPIEASLKGMHVEGLIEASDVMFRIEDNSAASDVIEQAIAYMQFVAHPSFNILDLNTRLEYKYYENRAFHILILKYIHLLSNRACHRTALELAKLLMNLDPSDPLAVVFIIDTLAIRAREHYWLVETIEYLDKDREVGYLFNIKFSKALASFHVSNEAHGDMDPCGQMLQHALLAYPWALREILDAIKHTDDALRSHELFNEFALKSTSKYLKDLIHLYAALTASQWREPPVLDWFKENARLIAETYSEDRFMREGAVSLEGMRQSLFRGWPEQIQRHLTIIKPMSNLLVDGAVPEVTSTRGYDPMPPRDGINRYGYTLLPRAQTSHGNAILADFFASLMPNYDVPQEGEDPQTSLVQTESDLNLPSTSGTKETTEESHGSSEKNTTGETSDKKESGGDDPDDNSNNDDEEGEDEDDEDDEDNDSDYYDDDDSYDYSDNFSDDTDSENPSEKENDDENNDENNDENDDENNDANNDENIDFFEENWEDDDDQYQGYLEALRKLAEEQRRAEEERRAQELAKQQELDEVANEGQKTQENLQFQGIPEEEEIDESETDMKVAFKIQPPELPDCFNNKGNEACGSQIEYKNDIKIYVGEVDAIEEDANEVYEAQTGQNIPEIIYEEEADGATPDEEEPYEPMPNEGKPDDTNSEEAKSHGKTCVTSPNEDEPYKTNSGKVEACEINPDEGESHEANFDDGITFEVTPDEEEPSKVKPNLSQAQ